MVSRSQTIGLILMIDGLFERGCIGITVPGTVLSYTIVVGYHHTTSSSSAAFFMSEWTKLQKTSLHHHRKIHFSIPKIPK